jgi:hypothetical protein
MVTSPTARIVTPVFFSFFLKVTVTPLGMVTIPKLKTPLSGIWRTVFTVGEKSPSAPVLPLTNAAKAVSGVKRNIISAPIFNNKLPKFPISLPPLPIYTQSYNEMDYARQIHSGSFRNEENGKAYPRKE